MIQFLLAAVNYVRKKPLSFIIIVTVAIARQLMVENNDTRALIPAIPQYGPENLPALALEVDAVTRAYTNPVNRPATIFFSDNKLLFENEKWKKDPAKLAKVKSTPQSFAIEIVRPINVMINNFIDSNKFLNEYSAKGYFVAIWLNFNRWTTVLNAAVTALELSDVTCGEMAALNKVLSGCFVKNFKAEIISVKNKERSHVFVVLERAKNSKLNDPKAWQGIIVDTWGSNVNQIYSSKNLPKILTEIKWDTWEVSSFFDLENELNKLQIPMALKNEFINLVNLVVDSIMEKIKLQFPKAYQILNDELSGDLSCVRPFRMG